jgi:hypothetical protein
MGSRLTVIERYRDGCLPDDIAGAAELRQQSWLHLPQADARWRRCVFLCMLIMQPDAWLRIPH